MAGDINFIWNRDIGRLWECRNVNNRYLIVKKKEEIVCIGFYIVGIDLCVL